MYQPVRGEKKKKKKKLSCATDYCKCNCTVITRTRRVRGISSFQYKIQDSGGLSSRQGSSRRVEAGQGG